ncbi:hypothetical protein [Oceanobacillus neutriphilus]|uniref:Uncharacterized protein n=1 Tax=Oceanobacillus neutriphilus TaxID=531815 RepID=A0ABQ2NUF3_9BACI|nr:hypothetical protein [Oceanobacillus neutriphilus]GGP10791.1 hypothetical protein GCM10011346_20320 [Oceanobacillus neutriphilus]
MDIKKTKIAPFVAFAVKITASLLLYFTMVNIRNESTFFPYNDVVLKTNESLFYKTIYFMMNFTEGEFYGGLLTSIMLIIGAFIAWNLYKNNSKWQGFAISGGSGVWPWVFASQIISLFLTIYVFDFVKFFSDDVLWLPTFIVVVGTPPALTLVYGPGLKKLLTISVLSALFTFPFVHWLNQYIMPLLHIPSMVSNVATMAFVGLIVSAICHQLPWMKRETSKIALERANTTVTQNTETFFWSIRRTLADFSEAWFYGNELVGVFVIVGVMLDWLINIEHITNGSGLVPEILMGQIVASSVGVLLYRKRFEEQGWQPTFMPLVSTVPGVILMMGGGIGIALISAVLSGIMSAPVGDYISKRLPDYVPGAVGFVSGMTIVTILVSAVMHTL